MEAGRLRERVTIEAESRVSNGQGGYTTSWSAIASDISAEIIGMSGDEALRLGVERSASQYRVTLRKRDGLTPKHRLQWKGQVMAINSVLAHPRYPQTHLLLICQIGLGS